jgi:GntR family transcriptional regulator, transcriptional repressor for pyruvate dehydrogenase complex
MTADSITTRRARAAGNSAMKAVGRAPNLPSRVARMISEEIVGGRIKAGDRLPTEREFAESFGVSRNVVREAIAKLRFEGVVETRQGVGVFVLGEESRSVLRIDAEILRDRSLMSSLFELRSIIEVEAAGLAAARRSRADLAAIKTALHALYSSEGSESSADADIAFHRAIVHATDNIYVATFINFIWEHVRTSIAEANLHLDHATRMPINRKEHTAIYDAIKARDVEQVASACESTSPMRWDDWVSPKYSRARARPATARRPIDAPSPLHLQSPKHNSILRRSARVSGAIPAGLPMRPHRGTSANTANSVGATDKT